MQDGSVLSLKAFFRNKWVLLTLALNALVIIIVIIVSLINNSIEEVTLTFNIVPADSQISINGSSENTGNSYRLSPGAYEIVVSHPDLDSKTFTVNLSEGDDAILTTFLSKDGNFDYYTQRIRLNDFRKLASIASANYNKTTDQDTSAEKFIANFQKNYDLYFTALPITYSEYSDGGLMNKYITIRKSDKCNLTLCLNARIYSDDDQVLVKKLLEEKGFNTEDFEIEYTYY